MKKTQLKWFLILQALLLLYACTSMLAKFAAAYQPLSLPFLLFYGGMIFGLMIYALGWQQVLKHIDLTAAYANKAVVVVWGIILGTLIFGERLELKQIIGSAVIIAGVVLYAKADMKDGEANEG